MGPNPDTEEVSLGIDFHPVLRCGLVRVDLTSTTVVFTLPTRHCTDMEGAIELARVLNPDVNLIATISGEKLDTCYGRMDREWSVVDGWKLLGRERRS